LGLLLRDCTQHDLSAALALAYNFNLQIFQAGGLLTHYTGWLVLMFVLADVIFKPHFAHLWCNGIMLHYFRKKSKLVESVFADDFHYRQHAFNNKNRNAAQFFARPYLL
jgi:hypothetical protein